jgi:NAD-dependent dihydropyrimidine dehydrogenase PreA subunit
MSEKKLPAITADDCTGCYACVDACEPQCMAIVDGVAVLTAPERCQEHGHCVEACPTNAIEMR